MSSASNGGRIPGDTQDRGAVPSGRAQRVRQAEASGGNKLPHGSPHRPRLLDLFCGAGGAAMGYSRAGFEVVGVDIKPQPNYPFEFHWDDALAVLAAWSADDMGAFDAIHASPPCQSYTTMSNRWGSDYPQLIHDVRVLLIQTGLPYVIENVPGARDSMMNPYRLTGETFNLRVHRPRLFETNWPWLVPYPPERQADPVAVYGRQDGRRLWTRTDGTELRVADLAEGSAAMDIDWMDWDELREAIPPAYTEFIGTQLMEYLHRQPCGHVGTRHLIGGKYRCEECQHIWEPV